MQEREIGHSLDGVEACEKDELGVLIQTHLLDMRFEDLQYLLPILLKVDSRSAGDV